MDPQVWEGMDRLVQEVTTITDFECLSVQCSHWILVSAIVI